MKVQLRPWMSDLASYVPGRKAAVSAGSMASNEPALAGSPAVHAAFSAAAETLHLYPDPLARELCQRVAELHGVDIDQVLVGNGSDELIFLLVLAYASMGGKVLLAEPPYRIHELAPEMLGAEVAKVPLVEWRHDLETMALEEADIAFVCNPHNPTGTALSASELARFTDRCRSGLVVVDEAYVDFADEVSATTSMERAGKGDLVVIRTFSKLFGLAGLRVGYMVGPTDVISQLRALRMPFSVNSPAQAAAVAALEDTKSSEAVRSYTLGAKETLRSLFAEAGYESVPSQANFLLVLAPDEESLVRRLARGGVSVRSGSALGIPGSVRVSVPSPEGMELLRSALASSG